MQSSLIPKKRRSAADPRWLAAAIGLQIIGPWLTAIRWRGLLTAQGFPLPQRELPVRERLVGLTQRLEYAQPQRMAERLQLVRAMDRQHFGNRLRLGSRHARSLYIRLRRLLSS